MVFVKKLVRQSAQLFSNMTEFEQAAIVEANSSESRDLEEYLNSWGLGMYIDKFKEHSVDLDTLQILSAEDIKELVPVIGHRAKLTTQIAMLKEIITDAFTDKSTAEVISITEDTDKIYFVLDDEPPEEQQIASSDLTRDTNKDCELYKLLSSSNEGKGLLLQFQENGLLDNAARRRLCNIIICNEGCL